MDENKASSGFINFNGTSSNVQIQQGSMHSTQTIQSVTSVGVFDYELVLGTLMKIKHFAAMEEFRTEFGYNADKARGIIDESIQFAESKSEPKKITQILGTLKELAVGVAGGVISSGIVGLLSQLPIWQG